MAEGAGDGPRPDSRRELLTGAVPVPGAAGRTAGDGRGWVGAMFSDREVWTVLVGLVAANALFVQAISADWLHMGSA